MKKVLFSFAFSFLFVVLVIFPTKQGNTLVGDEVSNNVEYQSGYSEGYRDAMDGVESLCTSKKCKAQDPYERGYKLGYKKGVLGREKESKKGSNKEFARPLIDSPGKTIGSDFNGDGIHDFLVSAFLNDDGGADVGAAYIFFGANNLSGTKNLGTSASADVTILGENSKLGEFINSAGDVNGDGIDDIIVADQNQAFIFFGATTLSGTLDMGGPQSADVTILAKASDVLGNSSVSGAGDINGDGFDDFIVGARFQDDGPGNNGGAAYIFFGSSTISGTKDLGGGQSADVTILGKAAGDNLGYGASGAGDINGDGFDDIIVAAPYNDDGASNAGTVYIFFGASDIGNTKSLGEGSSADVTILGKAADNYLGRRFVAGAGDVNGDGFDDFITHALGNDDGATNAGAAYIFFGASNLSGTKNMGGGDSADVTILGKAANDNLGSAFSGVGDINADGIPDVIIGAKKNDDGGTSAGAGDNEGAAYVFFGATDLGGTKNLGGIASADVTILGKALGDNLGNSVGGGRDNPGS